MNQPTDTKSALLDSAEAVARRHGYDGFSYADLSRDVGIRKASIHHHFPTKADLAHALMERYRRRFMERLAAIAHQHPKAGDRLTAYVQTYRDALSGGEMLCLCVSFSASRDHLAEPIQAELGAFSSESQAWLTEVFRLGHEDGTIASVAEPSSEASACLALVEGAQILARASRALAPFDDAVTLLLTRAG